jgi:tetratricopeptide (TPR) repeat protein
MKRMQISKALLSLNCPTRLVRGAASLGALVGLLLPGLSAAGQYVPSRPGTHRPPPASSSQKQHGGSQTKPTSGATANISQQDLADVVLRDTLDQVEVQADAHFHKGEYNHIINLNHIIVEGDPKDMDAFGNAAHLLWSTDRNEEALAFLKQGLAANPDNYYMYDEIGNHYFHHLRDPVSAIPYYEKAVKYQNCPFMSWNSLAHCYEKTNQWEKAVHAWETANNYTGNVAGPSNLKRARAELAKRKQR